MISRLDRILNKVSMYRLVSIALTLLWINSLILSVLGILEYDFLALLVSGVILITTTTLSNILLGRLYGIRTHDESSYITALILLFIFPPSLEPSALMALGLVGVIASASKYLLALHGRHIFNPAAAGALIASVAGIMQAIWWAGTPVLLPLTLVLTPLILYKTGRLIMGSIFLVVASSAVLLLLLSYGTSISEALPLLASWPLLFFVGFMLSEPLTLPKKTWQQYAEAGIVGVVFALPLHFNDTTLNPAAALLIGNLLAAIVSHRRHIKLTLVGTAPLTPTTCEYTFKTQGIVTYEPGQYIEITLPHAHKDLRGVRRVFSITSAPGSDVIKLGVKHASPSSSFKKALQALPLQSTIHATGTGGSFTLPPSPSTPLLFFAGGIGITPFISHLASLDIEKQSRDITLIYVVSHPDEIAYEPLLKKSGIRVIVVTPYTVKHPVEHWQYIMASWPDDNKLHELVNNLDTRQVYIAGPPTMVRKARKQLAAAGALHIQTDDFMGY